MLQSVVATAGMFIFSLSFLVRRTAVDPLRDDVRSALKTDVACAIFRVIRIATRCVLLGKSATSRKGNGSRFAAEAVGRGVAPRVGGFRSAAIMRGVDKVHLVAARLVDNATVVNFVFCSPCAASVLSRRGVLAVAQEIKPDIRVRIPTYNLATGNNIAQ